MKKLVYLFLAGAIVMSSCSKDDSSNNSNPPASTTPQVAVEKKNTSLVQAYSSTTEAQAGSWGWGLRSDAFNYGGAKSISMSAYINNATDEGFKLKLASDLYANSFIDNSFIPVVSVNGVMRQQRNALGEVQVPSELKLCERAIDSFATAAVVANTGVKYTVAGGKMTINSSVKFFAAASGTYNVAFYVVEDKAMWKQAGKSETPIEHPYVLRASANGTFGQQVFVGDIKADTFKDVNAEIAVDNTWKMANVKVYAVIWKKAANNINYVFVNASASK